MKRKVMALLLSATMAALTLAGCGSAQSDNTEQTTVAETQTEVQSEEAQTVETERAIAAALAAARSRLAKGFIKVNPPN